ncbi:MAG: metallophosphoesterase [Comamonadaceae bacterium]|nr:MAG: metallophosphoesterase [Comamonadaceae bacterium]
MRRIGLISDTHGLLRPEVLDFLRGSDHIIHAGDICTPEILDQLRALAPITAVRGNNDVGPWADALLESETVVVEDVRIHVIHDVAELGAAPPPGVQAVITGHSHKPRVEQRGGVLWVNPGSAGPRRFTLPIAAGELLVDGAEVSANVVKF